MKIRKQLDADRAVEINAKMMLDFVSSTGGIGVKILLAFSSSARCQGKRIKFFCFFVCIYWLSVLMTYRTVERIFVRNSKHGFSVFW